MKLALVSLLASMLFPAATWAQRSEYQPPSCSAMQKAYTVLRQRDTRPAEQAFLRAFPATYPTFTRVFGYSGRDSRTTSVQFGCLYETSWPYIEHLFSLRQVARPEVFSKLLGIARHAQWQSDGLNYLQDHCIKLATTDRLFLAFLNQQPEAEQRSFTRFLLLNPVPNEPLQKQLKATYAPYSQLKKVLH